MPYPEIEVSLKIKRTTGQLKMPVICEPAAAMKVIKAIYNKQTIMWTEEALMLCHNAGNKLIGWYRVAAGGTGTVNMDKRVIATIAAKCAATAVILCHNHPGGTLAASKEDIYVTKEILQGLDFFGVQLSDHIIFTADGYMSMKAQGII